VKVDGRTETRVAAKVIEGGPELEKEAYMCVTVPFTPGRELMSASLATNFFLAH
jgi:hypothetical protein